MFSPPSPSPLRLLVLCVGLVLGGFVAQAQQEEEPLRPGDRIDVTLQSGAIFEYAKVIEVTKDSLMVASPQGVREFSVQFLTPDLQARMPGAQPKPQTPPAPEPVAQQPAPADLPPPVDLDALAEALFKKINAQQPAQPAPSPAPIETAVKMPATPQNTFYQALAFGLILIIPTLNVLATRSAILHARGSSVPVWVLTIWLLPLIGAVCAFAALGRDVPTIPTAKS